MLMNMSKLLKVANENNFAVPAFNISSESMLKGVIKSCEEEKSPVIIAIHPNELEFTGDSFVEMVKDVANKTNIPVVLHLDHGSTIEQINRAVRDGFTSVMIDASTSTIEENIELTKKVIEIAHPLNISVEAELGTIGTTDGDSEGGTEEIIYTKPEDAVKFVEETGCDCLAIAIGTAHGIYPEGFEPHLKLDLLSEIKSSVSIPLVLHGGSANPDSEIAEAVKRGVNKINISSDIKDAFFKECRVVLENKKLREPLDIFPACIEKMNETVVHKIRLFNSNDKLKYYSL
ncbi:ketose-bisphosphate aldolase [Peptacetobacter hiranonis]|uniref:Ketose-bisphosphate aldolase n=1 Tax=Peptacetobacter hiranonis (strain DSM 13275 / JCM 10541 / KCTC 15199 / TO-931) TaxID=500633 RepID=B6G212_PEPHT|nr:ketose-bisphosphate aldolase [Peptacetobacter hiranonis]EEA84156.1 ketose-bisphosphate aldolase [Peptacetobacter hiranonis DSM 13275]QEK19810.1 putative fructose-bisphosphate aldolase [Peptacetobacter hiranonis]